MIKDSMSSISQLFITKARFFLPFAFFFILPELSISQEASNPLEKAQTLIDSGNAEEAYDLLKPYQASL